MLLKYFIIVFAKKVGSDSAGNVYYAAHSSNKRWVIFDGMIETTKVPPMWHAWLHHMSDEIPSSEDCLQYEWQREHIPNVSGTKYAYYPEGHLLTKSRGSVSRRSYVPWHP